MEDSVFTKIIKGEIPSYKIYEDNKTLAFLDIHLVAEKMVLVIPKQQAADVEMLDDDYYAALWTTVKKVALRLRQVFPEAKKIAMQVEGLDVAHAHVKLFPFNTSEEFREKPTLAVEPDDSALTALAERLKI
jgi:histidine triad (HIT) family protein